MRRGENSHVWIIKNPKRRETLLSFNRPRTKTEIEIIVKQKLELSENTNIKLREYINRNLIYCLNPGAREGRVYGLTKTGENNAWKIAKDTGIEWEYEVPEIDWNLYGWIVCGKRRRQLLKEILRKGKVTTANATGKVKAEKIVSETPRSYKYELIKEFVKRGLLIKIIESGVIIYTISEKGRKIAEVMGK